MKGNVYDLSPAVAGMFDIISGGSLLLHLLNPLRALTCIRSVTHELAIVETTRPGARVTRAGHPRDALWRARARGVSRPAAGRWLSLLVDEPSGLDRDDDLCGVRAGRQRRALWSTSDRPSGRRGMRAAMRPQLAVLRPDPRWAERSTRVADCLADEPEIEDVAAATDRSRSTGAVSDRPINGQ